MRNSLNSRRALRGVAQDVSRMDFRVDPPPTIPLAVQKTRASIIRPIDLRQLEDNGSVSDDTKVGEFLRVRFIVINYETVQDWDATNRQEARATVASFVVS